MSVAGEGPQFLVIGAQRAGTTWLHRVLQQHPALWLPPVKELHYFDKLDIERTILSPKERQRIGLKHLLTLNPWLFKFWFGARNDEWYASLFRAANKKGLVTGEVTPAYATLDEMVLERIRHLNDKVKLIFIMRDPIDRVWSAVANAARKGVDAGTVEKAIARAREPGAAARSAYAETIERIEALFPQSQIHYCFFEDLRDRPEALTAEVLAFLGVPPMSLKLPQAVNVAAGSRAPPLAFSRELAADYLPTVQRLCRRFKGPPQQWLARYEALLSDPDAGSPAVAAATK